MWGVRAINVALSPNKLLLTPLWQSDNPADIRYNKEREKNLQLDRTRNIISASGRRTIKKGIEWMLASCRNKKISVTGYNQPIHFKLAFITLTIPMAAEAISEEIFYDKLLHPFLVYFSKYHKLHNYVWKVERQVN